jgi:hypothetical protein
MGIHQIHSDYANPSEDYEWSFVLLVCFVWLGRLCIILLKVNIILSNDDQYKNISMFRDCHLSFRECMFFHWVTIFSHEEIFQIISLFCKIHWIFFYNFPQTFLLKTAGEFEIKCIPFRPFTFYVNLSTINLIDNLVSLKLVLNTNQSMVSLLSWP